MNRTMRRDLLIIAVAVFILGLFAILMLVPENKGAPKAERGFLDLSKWNFPTQGNVRLAGVWGFYWKQFLDPEQVLKTPPTSFIEMPSGWNSTKPDGEVSRGLGFATHTLRVRLPEHTRELALLKGELNSAVRVWINDQLILQQGV